MSEDFQSMIEDLGFFFLIFEKENQMKSVSLTRKLQLEVQMILLTNSIELELEYALPVGRS